MNQYTPVLWRLAEAVLDSVQLGELHTVVQAAVLDYAGLVAFDLALGGPSLDRLTCNDRLNCADGDRDLFRSLQYCYPSFYSGSKNGTLEWHTRTIVQMSALHLEDLVKRIARMLVGTMGAALYSPLIKLHIGQPTRQQLHDFLPLYNSAKHDMDHPKDTHLFSVEDAILAYVVSRQLARPLYGHARLQTNLQIYDQPCS
ncbi:MAG: hypothetical protein M3Z04_06180 [Chloroflexota bacterium]|nr:hypothetical protein [Chloroflexota bacterium]